MMRSAWALRVRCVHCNGTGHQIQRVRLSEPQPTGRRVPCRTCNGTGGLPRVKHETTGEFIGRCALFVIRYCCGLFMLYAGFTVLEWLYRLVR